MTLLCLIAISFLGISNVVLCVCIYREHQRTCDRLMSKDITEYKRNDGEPRERQDVYGAHQRAIDDWRSRGRTKGE